MLFAQLSDDASSAVVKLQKPFIFYNFHVYMFNSCKVKAQY